MLLKKFSSWCFRDNRSRTYKSWCIIRQIKAWNVYFTYMTGGYNVVWVELNFVLKVKLYFFIYKILSVQEIPKVFTDSSTMKKKIPWYKSVGDLYFRLNGYRHKIFLSRTFALYTLSESCDEMTTFTLLYRTRQPTCRCSITFSSSYTFYFLILPISCFWFSIQLSLYV